MKHRFFILKFSIVGFLALFLSLSPAFSQDIPGTASLDAKWQLGFQASPDLCSTIRTSNEFEYNDYDGLEGKAKIRPVPGFSSILSASKKLNAHWRIEFGLGYAQYGYTLIRSSTSRLNDPTDPLYQSSTKTSSVKNRYDYITVPFRFTYINGTKPTRFLLSLGSSLGFAVYEKHTVKVTTYGGETTTRSYHFQNPFIPEIYNWFADLGLGFDRRFSGSWGMRVMPYLNMALVNSDHNTYSLPHLLFKGGISFGIYKNL